MHWDLASPLIETWNSRRGLKRKEDTRSLGAFAHRLPYANRTRHVARLKETLVEHIGTVDDCINDHLNRHVRWNYRKDGLHVEMLIFDEAERLSVTGLNSSATYLTAEASVSF